MVETCRDVKVKHIHAILQCEKVGRLLPTTSRSSQFLELPLHPPETRCFHFHFPLCPWTGFVPFSLTWQACIFGVTSLRAVKCRRHCGLLWYHRFSWQALPAKSGVRVSGVALIPFRFWISFPVVSLEDSHAMLHGLGMLSCTQCSFLMSFGLQALMSAAVNLSKSVSPPDMIKVWRNSLWSKPLKQVKMTAKQKSRQKHERSRVSPKKKAEENENDAQTCKNHAIRLTVGIARTPRCDAATPGKTQSENYFAPFLSGRWSFPSFFDRSSVLWFFLVSFCSFCCPFKECLDRSRGNITSDRSALRCLAMGLALRRHEVRDK